MHVDVHADVDVGVDVDVNFCYLWYEDMYVFIAVDSTSTTPYMCVYPSTLHMHIHIHIVTNICSMHEYMHTVLLPMYTYIYVHICAYIFICMLHQLTYARD